MRCLFWPPSDPTDLETKYPQDPAKVELYINPFLCQKSSQMSKKLHVIANWEHEMLGFNVFFRHTERCLQKNMCAQ